MAFFSRPSTITQAQLQTAEPERMKIWFAIHHIAECDGIRVYGTGICPISGKPEVFLTTDRRLFAEIDARSKTVFKAGGNDIPSMVLMMAGWPLERNNRLKPAEHKKLILDALSDGSQKTVKALEVELPLDADLVRKALGSLERSQKVRICDLKHCPTTGKAAMFYSAIREAKFNLGRSWGQ